MTNKEHTYKHFTTKEEDFIRETINTLSVRQQAMELGRTEHSVAGRRRTLGLKADKAAKSQPLSLEQVETLRRKKGYKSYSDCVIGEGLR